MSTQNHKPATTSDILPGTPANNPSPNAFNERGSRTTPAYFPFFSSFPSSNRYPESRIRFSPLHATLDTPQSDHQTSDYLPKPVFTANPLPLAPSNRPQPAPNRLITCRLPAFHVHPSLSRSLPFRSSISRIHSI